MSSELLSGVLGAGGVAFLGAIIKGYAMLRDGAQARERTAIAGLERYRVDADNRAASALETLDFVRSLVTYWQSRAGALEYELNRLGHIPPQPPPLPMPTAHAPPRDTNSD